MLAGRRLEYVRLGHAFVLSFTGGGQVLVETAVQLAAPGARRTTDLRLHRETLRKHPLEKAGRPSVASA